MEFCSVHRDCGSTISMFNPGCFLTQHVLEPTRGENVLDIVLCHKKN